MVGWLATLALAIVAVASGCGPRKAAPPEEPAELTDEQRETLARLETIGYLTGINPATSAESVTVYDPERAYNGLNLMVSGHGPKAALFNMEGTVLHEWSYDYADVWPERGPPEFSNGDKYWRRVHLYKNGDLLAIYEGQGLIKINKDSELLWAFGESAHHDLEVLDNGDIWVLTRQPRMAGILPRIKQRQPVLDDYFTLLDPDGNVKRRISVIDAFGRSEFKDFMIDSVPEGYGYVFHTNTLEVLDGSQQHRSPIFKKGNILTSFKMVSTIAIVDPDTETVVWKLTGRVTHPLTGHVTSEGRGPWVRQHQPVLLDNGNMLLFDNNSFGDHSAVYELEPLTGEIVWTYEASPPESFYTEACGSSQLLPNGNVLITESEDGRAFEVQRDGTIVWEYFNPHRVGQNNELVAYLYEVVRLPPDFPTEWTDRQPE